MNELTDDKNHSGDSDNIEEAIKNLETKREAILEMESKRQRVSSIFTWLSLAIATASFGYYISHFLISNNSYSNIDKQTEIIDKRLDSLLKLFDTTNAFKTIVIHDTISKGFINETEFKSELKKVKDDLNKLDDIILDNPEKALTIPLLKRELGELKTNVDKNQDAIKNDITRIYDLFKWVGGLIFTLLLSLLGLAFSNIFFKKKETTEKIANSELEELKKLLDDLKKPK